MIVKQSTTIPFLSTNIYYSFVTPSCFEQFPSINENATLDLSVIIPAYNEELRLPKMLDECLPYLVDRSKRDPYFILVIFILVLLLGKSLLLMMEARIEQRKLVMSI